MRLFSNILIIGLFCLFVPDVKAKGPVEEDLDKGVNYTGISGAKYKFVRIKGQKLTFSQAVNEAQCSVRLAYGPTGRDIADFLSIVDRGTLFKIPDDTWVDGQNYIEAGTKVTEGTASVKRKPVADDEKLRHAALCLEAEGIYHSPSKQPICPDDYDYGPLADLCFKFFKKKETFDDANITCYGDRGELVKISTLTEFYNVMGAVMSVADPEKEAMDHEFFVGLKSNAPPKNGGVFRWNVDNQPLFDPAAGFLNILPHLIHLSTYDGDKLCVRLDKKMKEGEFSLKEEDCDDEREFVCQCLPMCPPMNIANALPIDKTHADTIVYVQCNARYELIPGSTGTVICTLQSEWIASTEYCQPITTITSTTTTTTTTPMTTTTTPTTTTTTTTPTTTTTTPTTTPTTSTTTPTTTTTTPTSTTTTAPTTTTTTPTTTPTTSTTTPTTTPTTSTTTPTTTTITPTSTITTAPTTTTTTPTTTPTTSTTTSTATTTTPTTTATTTTPATTTTTTTTTPTMSTTTPTTTPTTSTATPTTTTTTPTSVTTTTPTTTPTTTMTTPTTTPTVTTTTTTTTPTTSTTTPPTTQKTATTTPITTPRTTTAPKTTTYTTAPTTTTTTSTATPTTATTTPTTLTTSTTAPTTTTTTSTTATTPTTTITTTPTASTKPSSTTFLTMTTTPTTATTPTATSTTTPITTTTTPNTAPTITPTTTTTTPTTTPAIVSASVELTTEPTITTKKNIHTTTKRPKTTLEKVEEAAVVTIQTLGCVWIIGALSLILIISLVLRSVFVVFIYRNIAFTDVVF